MALSARTVALFAGGEDKQAERRRNIAEKMEKDESSTIMEQWETNGSANVLFAGIVGAETQMLHPPTRQLCSASLRPPAHCPVGQRHKLAGTLGAMLGA
jgi:hypothetical protein